MWFAGAALSGCGAEEGYSGVAPHKRVGDLSGDEMRALCTWVIERQGGEGAVHDCGDGVSVRLDTVAECVAEQDDFSGCSLTVSQLEVCVLDAGPDPCRAPATPTCQPLGECLFGP